MTKLHLWSTVDDEPDAAIDHDYRPEWDYPVVPAPQGEAGEILAEAMDRIGKDVLPALGLENAVVFTVEEGTFGDCVGRYVNGTSSCPFIGVDAAKIWRVAGPEGFRDEAVATIVHELGHAHLDGLGVDEDDPEAHYEDAVEEFAQHYVETGEVSLGSISLQIIAASFRN